MRRIPLTKGQVAFVDDEDYELVSQWSWYAQPGVNTFYANRRGPRDANGHRETVHMHRLVLGLPNSAAGIVDHINRNGLDNRKANLRITDKRGNALNAITARQPRDCEWCGESYMPSHTAARFCGSRCFGKANTSWRDRDELGRFKGTAA